MLFIVWGTRLQMLGAVRDRIGEQLWIWTTIWNKNRDQHGTSLYVLTYLRAANGSCFAFKLWLALLQGRLVNDKTFSSGNDLFHAATPC